MNANLTYFSCLCSYVCTWIIGIVDFCLQDLFISRKTYCSTISLTCSLFKWLILTLTLPNPSISPLSKWRNLEGLRAVGPNNDCLSLGQAYLSKVMLIWSDIWEKDIGGPRSSVGKKVEEVVLRTNPTGDQSSKILFIKLSWLAGYYTADLSNYC